MRLPCKSSPYHNPTLLLSHYFKPPPRNFSTRNLSQYRIQGPLFKKMSSSSETEFVRFMIISDTHSFKFGDAGPVNGKFAHPLPKVDVLLHAGDLTYRGGLDEYRECIKMLGSIDAELKLVIAGNHDLTLDEQYWASHEEDSDDPNAPENGQHRKAVQMWTGKEARDAGITYLEEGLRTYRLQSGATFTIYTSPYQPEFCDWAFPYHRSEDRFNPADKVDAGFTCIAKNPVPDHPKVDVMMTHGPPRDILDWTEHGNVGCQNSLRAVSRARPQLYCFGHIHEAYGAKVVKWKDDKNLIGPDAIEEETDVTNAYPQASNQPILFGEETLMVNASIMNLRYRPANSPWVVDLELPKPDPGRVPKRKLSP